MSCVTEAVLVRLRDILHRLSRCHRKGHDWFPDVKESREFIPVENICLRCGTVEVLLPTGQCLGGHPLSQHYTTWGNPKPHPTCPGSQ